MLVLRRSRDNESVHSMGRGKLVAGEELTSTLSDHTCKIGHQNRARVEETNDSGVASIATADLGKNWRWNTNQRARLVRHGENRSRSRVQGSTFRRVGERVKRLRIENYRFGHWRRTRASSAGGTGPSSASISARRAPRR